MTSNTLEMKVNKLTRQDKINLCVELHKNAQEGLSMPSEYTIPKYDFMLSEGFILCPNDKREEYMNIAKGEYQYELNNMVHTDSLVKGHTAAELLVKMEKGEFTFEQMKYLSDKVKIIALKHFMAETKELKFT